MKIVITSIFAIAILLTGYMSTIDRVRAEGYSYKLHKYQGGSKFERNANTISDNHGNSWTMKNGVVFGPQGSTCVQINNKDYCN